MKGLVKGAGGGDAGGNAGGRNKGAKLRVVRLGSPAKVQPWLAATTLGRASCVLERRF